MTNKEIAKKLGISPAALSLVINHKPGVSDETRATVLQKLEEMGYEHLIKKAPVIPSNNLCFIIYKRHGEILDLHPFFLLLMENIETHARKYGYNILLCTIDKRKPLESQIQHINELNCQGAIIFATEMNDEDMREFSNLTIPVVTMDNDFTRLTCNSVSINNQMGTYQAIEYLIKENHTRIGYLKCAVRISSFKERHTGYDRALKHFGLEFNPEDIIILGYTEESSYRDMKHYLSKHNNPSLPSAFVCDDDTMAVGALRALSEAGYKVPKEISIIGFNDRPTCEVTVPPLTTINVSKRSFSEETVDELMRLIRNHNNDSTEFRSRKVRIGTKLIKRDSVSRIL
ncbi:MAG: LacI family DNA-binding transcriptional regulator [Lachnospiraceae bacterium]|nr:LacI family DNA-binding transcriptional regulator [Lachnospiraceae bacterium]